MTTTDAELDIKDIYSPQQVTRMAALQGVAEFVHVLSGTIGSGVLIELAEYVIGDDEPFDPVAVATEAREALNAERGYNYNGYDDGEGDWADDYNANPFDGHDGCDEGWCYEHDLPLARWERVLLAGLVKPTDREREEPVVGDITVSDLAGFLTLPKTAELLDADGDAWYYSERRGGWTYAGVDTYRSPAEIFHDLGWGGHDDFDFIVTNPEVLS